MTRLKIFYLKWTLVLVIVVLCPFVNSRPQEESTSSSTVSLTTSDKPTESPNRVTTQNHQLHSSATPAEQSTQENSSRNVKTKAPAIGDSIKMVANQLLESSNNLSDTTTVIDTRIPPKLKNQVAQKHKIKTRNEDHNEKTEHSHEGVAVPVTMEDLEKENKILETTNESSTSNDGISTWILLSNPTAKDNASTSTEPTKVEEQQKKQKPSSSKNKTKRPQQNGNKQAPKRPIIASINKSDLIASGSAINDNVLNKIKDTVLSNVQKNKGVATHKTTTLTTTTITEPHSQEASTKEIITKSTTPIAPVVKITSKPSKKKNKKKQKISTTTEEPVINESALLPAEAKEQEIELEISTPATSTKKPKRTSTKRKKNKTKKRKTSTVKPVETSVTTVKTSNKTKSVKPAKTPESPISTQIFSYLSREVMPSVGVGVIGLAGLVGLASYFLYPFAAPVRRTFEVDKKDDIYRHNAEEYANEGNGQAEEEMLGTVLAGMPAHSKHKLNPYMGQMAHANRYPSKKEQDLKYRHVASTYDTPNYNLHYPQQKTGLAHGVVYPDNANYNQQQYETRHAYTTESKLYAYDKASYTPYPAAEPIYAAPQTAPESSGYGNDAGNSVVYGVKPSAETDFKPVYPFEGHVFSETTSNPVTYSPTSMYLGSNNEAKQQENTQYSQEINSNGGMDNKFVVGNVPKELVDSATPAVVPEHGPRNLKRKKRNVLRQKRGITGSIEEILKAAKANNKDIFISNEIDEALGNPPKNVVLPTESVADIKQSTLLPDVESATVKIPENKIIEKDTISPVYDFSKDSITFSADDITSTVETKIVESVSTVPLDTNRSDKSFTTTESDISNELDYTTKSFRVYEVFSSPSTNGLAESSPIIKEDSKEVSEATTEINKMITETTTDSKSETLSTLPTVPTVDAKLPTELLSSTQKPKPTDNPNVITYPPLNGEGSFFTFLKKLVEFKYRLGLSILQTTSDSLNRYLRGMESTVQRIAKAS